MPNFCQNMTESETTRSQTYLFTKLWYNVYSVTKENLNSFGGYFSGYALFFLHQQYSDIREASSFVRNNRFSFVFYRTNITIIKKYRMSILKTVDELLLKKIIH